jgi:hypothetical protein
VAIVGRTCRREDDLLIQIVNEKVEMVAMVEERKNNING